MKVLVFVRSYLGLGSKVDSHTAVEDNFVIKGFPYEDCALSVEEGDNDSAEGFERRPALNGNMLIY